MKKDKKFNPVDCGLLKRKDKDGEIEYVYLEKNKVIGRLWHVNYTQGLPIEWNAYKIVHCFNGTTKQHCVFSGKISSNDFGKELIKNLFY